MTRVEAIKVLNMVKAYGVADEAKKMAIKALSSEPCEDCISREAVYQTINFWEMRNSLHYFIPKELNEFSSMIKDLPSVQPKPKTGNWIDREVYDADRWKCSECGRTEMYKENFCPNCGADMRGGDNG